MSSASLPLTTGTTISSIQRLLAYSLNRAALPPRLPSLFLRSSSISTFPHLSRPQLHPARQARRAALPSLIKNTMAEQLPDFEAGVAYWASTEASVNGVLGGYGEFVHFPSPSPSHEAQLTSSPTEVPPFPASTRPPPVSSSFPSSPSSQPSPPRISLPLPSLRVLPAPSAPSTAAPVSVA